MTEEPNRITLTAWALTKLEQEFPLYTILTNGARIIAVCKFCLVCLTVDGFSVEAVNTTRDRIHIHDKTCEPKRTN